MFEDQLDRSRHLNRIQPTPINSDLEVLPWRDVVVGNGMKRDLVSSQELSDRIAISRRTSQLSDS